MALRKKTTKASSKASTKTKRRAAAQEKGARDMAKSYEASRFPIVGIGASAGGLQPFLELVAALPSDSGVAIVFLQHVDAAHHSELREIVQRTTDMRVAFVEDAADVERNTIYIAPPDGVVRFARGVMRVEPREKDTLLRVDTMLRTLAEDQGNRAIGVILSGTGSDGALGIRDIKAAGGITFAQDESAAFDGMPRAAITASEVDFVLPPSEIARELERIARHTYIARDGDGERFSEDELSRVFVLLRSAHDVDFSNYKLATIERRIRRRMAVHKIERLREYVDLLSENAAEIDHLYADLLIRVTSFFRDDEVFEALRDEVLPALLRKRDPDTPLRVWVAGCATGEEVYSIAIVFHELIDSMRTECPVQFFGTDISEPAIDAARAAWYPENIAAEVSPERLRRFFTHVDGGYRVNKSIRDCCVFARQNITKDPPFSKIDLISCRNVLIYLGATVQRLVMTMFHYALQPGGYLLLGNSETVANHADLFTVADRRRKVYQKKGGGTRLPAEVTRSLRTPVPARALRDRLHAVDADPASHAPNIQRYSPAGVVVDDQMEILQFRGRTSQYLEPAPGTASFDLLKMAREGLLAELRTAIHAARKTNAPVRRDGVPLTADGTICSLEVVPFIGADHARYYVVLFQPEEQELAKAKGSGGKTAPPVETKQTARLKRELEATREYLQSIIEDEEAMNEELRAANEEIQSSNEELQSTNEELETAKEELQSSNEELMTLNEELENRHDELAQANNDMLNLLAAIDLPVIMLDSNLCIRRFNPAAQRLNVTANDIGRPIGDARTTLVMDGITKSVAAVVDDLASRELEVRDVTGHTYVLRIRPYKTAENRIEGAVLVVIDVDREPQAAVISGGAGASAQLRSRRE
jgi:two-component system CheB/CheR fusion protein